MRVVRLDYGCEFGCLCRVVRLNVVLCIVLGLGGGVRLGGVAFLSPLGVGVLGVRSWWWC